jgi:hypothetical protein
MPEQPHRYERTLDMPPQDPWADQPTAPGPTGPPIGAGDSTAVAGGTAPSPFTQGRARVNPQAPQRQFAEHEPTGVGWPGAGAPPARGISWSWHELRRGNEWTTAAGLFAFVCWGIWALSGGGGLATSIIVLAVTLIVAAGVFCLARVVGYYVLERAFHRQRRSARGSHLVTALFLAGVGITNLQQTEWVMTAYHWVTDNLN